MLTGETEKKQGGRKQGGRGGGEESHRGAINTEREREKGPWMLHKSTIRCSDIVSIQLA